MTRRVPKTSGEIPMLETMMGVPDAIERQEARGQRDLVESAQLPVEGTAGSEDKWAAVGVELGPVEPGELFRDAKLPAGWKVKPTSHAMWSDLLDDQGRKRAGVFYKAAFYDRKASVTLSRRFTIGRDWERDSSDGRHVFVVKDCEATVFSGQPFEPPATPKNTGDREADCKAWDEYDKAEKRSTDAAVAECLAWLTERVEGIDATNISDVTLFWDVPGLG